MRAILGNMVWPALYVSEELDKFWYLVFGTIFIELILIKVLLKFSWIKSALSSLIGNIISGFAGTFLMVWAMILWHAIADSFLPNATFDIVNWISTFILMCLGSVFIETLAIGWLYKEPKKRLFLPMLTGNLLTYVFIAFSMITSTGRHPDEVASEKILYKPTQTHFSLNDGSNTIELDTAFIRVSYDKDEQVINETESLGYGLWIKYSLMQSDSFDFHLKLIDDEWAGGTTSTGKYFPIDSVQNEFVVLFEQRLMDSLAGYRKLQPTDTFKLIKLGTIRETTTNSR